MLTVYNLVVFQRYMWNMKKRLGESTAEELIIEAIVANGQISASNAIFLAAKKLKDLEEEGWSIISSLRHLFVVDLN